MPGRTLRTVVCVSMFCATGLAAGAAAQTATGLSEAGMTDFFKGSLTITMPAFQAFEVTRQFSPDHTFSDLDGGKVVRGVWSIENGKICTQRGEERKYCNLGLGRRIGDGWEDKDPYTGNEVDFDLVADRQPLS